MAVLLLHLIVSVWEIETMLLMQEEMETTRSISVFLQSVRLSSHSSNCDADVAARAVYGVTVMVEGEHRYPFPRPAERQM